MSAGDLALVVATVLCALAFAALVLVLARVLQALQAVQATLGRLSTQADELRATVDTARADLDRFDRVLGSAEAISNNVEGATRVAKVALSRPVIKTVALASGTQQAARRLRRPGR